MAGVGSVMTDTTLLETGWSEALEAIGTALDVEASARSSGALKRFQSMRAAEVAAARERLRT